MRAGPFAALLWCVALAGCGSLLPRSSADSPSTFESYAQAEAATGGIVAFRTRVRDLQALGFDIDHGSNVTLIPYPDIVARLAPYSGVALAELDPGIRQCILAQSACRAYLFRFDRLSRNREGGFWADFLNVRRVTNIRGWWFEALVVVSADTVLFRNHGGQARLDRVERQNNPLGPFQPAGEGVGTLLIR